MKKELSRNKYRGKSYREITTEILKIGKYENTNTISSEKIGMFLIDQGIYNKLLKVCEGNISFLSGINTSQKREQVIEATKYFIKKLDSNNPISLLEGTPIRDYLEECVVLRLLNDKQLRDLCNLQLKFIQTFPECTEELVSELLHTYTSSTLKLNIRGIPNGEYQTILIDKTDKVHRKVVKFLEGDSCLVVPINAGEYVEGYLRKEGVKEGFFIYGVTE